MKGVIYVFWLSVLVFALGCEMVAAELLPSVEIIIDETEICQFDVIVRNQTETSVDGVLTVSGSSHIKVSPEKSYEYNILSNGDRVTHHICDVSDLESSGIYLLKAEFEIENPDNPIFWSASKSIAVVLQGDAVKTGTKDQLGSFLGTQFYKNEGSSFEFGFTDLRDPVGTLLIKANAPENEFEPQMVFSTGESILLRQATIWFPQMEKGESRVKSIQFMRSENAVEGRSSVECEYNDVIESLPIQIEITKNDEGNIALSSKVVDNTIPARIREK